MSELETRITMNKEEIKVLKSRKDDIETEKSKIEARKNEEIAELGKKIEQMNNNFSSML